MGHDGSGSLALARMATVAAISAAMTVGGCGVGPRFEERRVDTLSAEPLSALRVSGEVGTIRVTGSPEATEVVATAAVRAGATSLTRAAEVLGAIRPSLAPGDDDPTVLVASSTGYEPSWSTSSSVDWDITVPSGMPVEVRLDVGDVSVRDLAAPVSVASDVGDVRLTGVVGPVSVTSEVGDVVVRSGGGPISVRVDVGDVSVEAMGTAFGPISAHSDVGDVLVTLPMSWAVDADLSTGVGAEREASGRAAPGATPVRVELSAEVGDVRLDRAAEG